MPSGRACGTPFDNPWSYPEDERCTHPPARSHRGDPPDVTDRGRQGGNYGIMRGEKIAIAGHVWVVDEVDFDRHIVYCTKVKGKVPAYFGDCPGDIQTKILERMRRVLQYLRQSL